MLDLMGGWTLSLKGKMLFRKQCGGLGADRRIWDPRENAGQAAGAIGSHGVNFGPIDFGRIGTQELLSRFR